MRTIENLIGIQKGNSALVIGAGSSIKEDRQRIDKFLAVTKPFTIGINNMTSLYIPTYHLWTNTKRFETFGKDIHPSSTLLLGSKIPSKTIRRVVGNIKYVLINYTDMKENVPIGYKKGKIYGFYRTAGCLSIMIAHLMGAKEINIVGMDGYTKYKKEDLESGKKSHHCYGSGYTDTKDWKSCVKGDELVYKALRNLKKYGINFRIITSTMYKDFYDGTLLEIKNEN